MILGSLVHPGEYASSGMSYILDIYIKMIYLIQLLISTFFELTIFLTCIYLLWFVSVFYAGSCHISNMRSYNTNFSYSQ